MVGPDSSRLLRERIFAASIALICIFLVGTFGYWLLGRTYLGKLDWDLGECAYMTVITITTVGFGELPHLARVPGGRVFTVFVLLSGLGIAAYFVSALTTYFIEGEFTKARTRRRMTKALDKIRDHIIVCGVGTTGVHVVEELVWTKWPLVAIDRDPARLEKLQELSVQMLPTVVGDATEDEVLERAGIRRARGIVAALTNDRDNLYIVVSARQLNPALAHHRQGRRHGGVGEAQARRRRQRRQSRVHRRRAHGVGDDPSAGGRVPRSHVARQGQEPAHRGGDGAEGLAARR